MVIRCVSFSEDKSDDLSDLDMHLLRAQLHIMEMEVTNLQILRQLDSRDRAVVLAPRGRFFWRGWRLKTMLRIPWLHAKTGSIRIILVDDHPSFRQGLRSLLGSYATLSRRRGRDGEEVVHSMPYICPSVIVMDINMPKLNGVEATRAIKANYPNVVIVGLSVHENNFYQTAMVAAGAKSVVSKAMAGLFLYRQIKDGVENLPPLPNAA